MDVYATWKCPTSKGIICANYHMSIQMNLAEVDQVTIRFNGQFKTYSICGPANGMGRSDDSIFLLTKANSIVSKNF